MKNHKKYDVVVIGGGVVGAFIARELTRFCLSVCVLEAQSDVALGASGANSGIVHGGFDPEPGTWKGRFNREGCHMMPGIARELDVPFQMIGSLVVAKNQREEQVLVQLMQRGFENGISGLRLLGYDELHRMEPALDRKIKSALFSQESGIICPYELTQAAMENAVCNGAEIFFDTRVTKIERTASQDFKLCVGDRTIESKIVVNAAGVYADQVYKMAASCATEQEYKKAFENIFVIQPKAGEYLLLDKSEGKTVRHVIFGVPNDKGKGILISPTVDGNLLLGPTSVYREERENTATTGEGLAQVKAGVLSLVPTVNFKSVITSFTGLRAASNHSKHDFIIGETAVSGFFNVAGIESPGLTSAPAIGTYLANLIAEKLDAPHNRCFNPVRTHIRFNNLSSQEKNELIKKNPLYAQIVCRCETITEGEVLDAIRRPCGARTLDGVKRRTRAGMGRCQGGFCSPRVVELLAKELQMQPNQILKSNSGSYILTAPTKSEE